MKKKQKKSNLPFAGLKYFKPLESFLKTLRAQYPNKNRRLTYDRYLSLMLLAFYNPTINSLRTLQKATRLKQTRKAFGLNRVALGSLSEAARVFDADELAPIFQELASKAIAVDARGKRSNAVCVPPELKILAADASLWRLVPRMCPELYKDKLRRNPKGHVKGHFLFSLQHGVPVKADFTDGKVDERHVLPQQLSPNVLYLLDRGYASRKLYKEILDAGASFVARLKRNIKYTIEATREINQTAKRAGVISDQSILWGKSLPKPMRLVIVKRVSQPAQNLHLQRKGGKHKAYNTKGELIQEWRLLTDRFDLSAEEIAKLYAYRWEIELFFRWFKCVLGCRHLFSECENGMRLQFYTALIAGLLVVIYTNRTPNKYIWMGIQSLFLGLADEDDVLSLIEEAPPRRKK